MFIVEVTILILALMAEICLGGSCERWPKNPNLPIFQNISSKLCVNITNDDININIGNVDFLKLLNVSLESLPGNLVSNVSVMITIEKGILQRLVSPGTTHNVKNMQLFAVDINELTFQEFPELEYIRIVQMNSIRIDENTFNGLNKLQSLAINWCNLRNISENQFKNLPSLETVTLLGTEIRNLSTKSFAEIPKLRKLFIYLNPIENEELNFENDLDSLELLWNNLNLRKLSIKSVKMLIINSGNVKEIEIKEKCVKAIAATYCGTEILKIPTCLKTSFLELVGNKKINIEFTNPILETETTDESE